MKYCCIGIISTFLFVDLYSQDTNLAMDSGRSSHIIGFNVMNFVGNILNYTALSQDAYFLNYRIDYGKKALRFGFGGRFSLSDSYQYPLSGKTGDSHSYTVAGRFGFEWKKPIIKKWELYYGIDQVTKWHNYKSIRYSGSNNIGYTDVSFDRDLNIGIGLFLGVNFMINPRIYLNTETNFIIDYFISEYKYINNSETSQSFGIRNYIVYPGLVWLNIRL